MSVSIGFWAAVWAPAMSVRIVRGLSQSGHIPSLMADAVRFDSDVQLPPPSLIRTRMRLATPGTAVRAA